MKDVGSSSLLLPSGVGCGVEAEVAAGTRSASLEMGRLKMEVLVFRVIARAWLSMGLGGLIAVSVCTSTVRTRPSRPGKTLMIFPIIQWLTNAESSVIRTRSPGCRFGLVTLHLPAF